MPIKINVPFNQKDEAKKLGAVWIPDVKTWVIGDSIENINPFKILGDIKKARKLRAFFISPNDKYIKEPNKPSWFL